MPSCSSFSLCFRAANTRIHQGMPTLAPKVTTGHKRMIPPARLFVKPDHCSRRRYGRKPSLCAHNIPVLRLSLSNVQIACLRRGNTLIAPQASRRENSRRIRTISTVVQRLVGFMPSLSISRRSGQRPPCRSAGRRCPPSARNVSTKERPTRLKLRCCHHWRRAWRAHRWSRVARYVSA